VAVRVRDAIKSVDQRSFFHESSALRVIASAATNEKAPLVRYLDAYIEALGHGLCGYDTSDVLAVAESQNVSLADAAQVVAEQVAARRRAAMPKTRRQRFAAWMAGWFLLEHADGLVH
ncbi:MAG: hypothetical protein ACREJM_06475, partial [Candidatus Saccharimonadales bacterium]